MLRLDMHMIAGVLQYVAVAFFAEAWIEIGNYIPYTGIYYVAFFAEAWIEIIFFVMIFSIFCRLLRGGVD